MGVKLDLRNQRFGRLLILREAPRKPIGQRGQTMSRWQAKCDCGKSCVVSTRDLRRGDTRSCGCLDKEHRIAFVKSVTTHGCKDKREYSIWKNMRARCNRKTHPDYSDYGGRGIKISGRWNDFALFLKDMGPCPDGYSIDRIDTHGNYEPKNCRWASAGEQARNKRNNIWVNLNGEQMILKDACRKLRLRYTTITLRIRRGWEPQEAIATPIREGNFR